VSFLVCFGWAKDMFLAVFSPLSAWVAGSPVARPFGPQDKPVFFSIFTK
jgi:hypothetical protein